MTPIDYDSLEPVLSVVISRRRPVCVCIYVLAHQLRLNYDLFHRDLWYEHTLILYYLSSVIHVKYVLVPIIQTRL